MHSILHCLKWNFLRCALFMHESQWQFVAVLNVPLLIHDDCYCYQYIIVFCGQKYSQSLPWFFILHNTYAITVCLVTICHDWDMFLILSDFSPERVERVPFGGHMFFKFFCFGDLFVKCWCLTAVNTWLWVLPLCAQQSVSVTSKTSQTCLAKVWK